MSNKLIRQHLEGGVGKMGSITPVNRSKAQSVHELEAMGITVGHWESMEWKDCFVPPTAERWLQKTPDYFWVPNG